MNLTEAPGVVLNNAPGGDLISSSANNIYPANVAFSPRATPYAANGSM